MAAGVEWIENPEFAAAFAAMLEGKEMAAHTNTTPESFPAFINIRFEGNNAILTMRGEPVEVPADKDNTAYTKPGKTVEAVFAQRDWDQFVAEAIRERGLVPGG